MKIQGEPLPPPHKPYTYLGLASKRTKSPIEHDDDDDVVAPLVKKMAVSQEETKDTATGYGRGVE